MTLEASAEIAVSKCTCKWYYIWYSSSSVLVHRSLEGVCSYAYCMTLYKLCVERQELVGCMSACESAICILVCVSDRLCAYFCVWLCNVIAIEISVQVPFV